MFLRLEHSQQHTNLNQDIGSSSADDASAAAKLITAATRYKNATMLELLLSAMTYVF